MSTYHSVALSDHFATFVENLVSSGRYGSPNDVLVAGLRLLEEHEATHKANARRSVTAERATAPVRFPRALNEGAR